MFSPYFAVPMVLFLALGVSPVVAGYIAASRSVRNNWRMGLFLGAVTSIMIWAFHFQSFLWLECYIPNRILLAALAGSAFSYLVTAWLGRTKQTR